MMTKLIASLPPATSMQSFHGKQYGTSRLHTTFPSLRPPLLNISLVNALLSTSAYLHALCTLFQPSTPARRYTPSIAFPMGICASCLGLNRHPSREVRPTLRKTTFRRTCDPDCLID